ncbi:MAG: DUF87 domain-containing protein [Candidatus Kapabacteria bacterium]|nr:DUF87 domain-containing protein [Candidatus Kapabacteria bacterium]
MTNDYQFSFGDVEPNYGLNHVWDNVKDKFYHTYIIGKTGCGKTSLMERMINYDIDQGLSTILIDPKGTMAKRIKFLHKENDNVKYISFDNFIDLNPIKIRGFKNDDLLNNFIDYLDTVITLTTSNPESTARMQQILANSLGSFKKKDWDLKYLYEFLTNYGIRQGHSANRGFEKKSAKYFWEEYLTSNPKFFNYTLRDFQSTMDSIATRLYRMVFNESLNKFFTNTEALDLESYVNTGKTLLVNTLTTDQRNVTFLSNLIMFFIIAYINNGNKKQNPLFVYVDEFQEVASPYFIKAYNLGREAQVGFTISHHNFAELPEPRIMRSIVSNCGTYCVFNCGYDEALVMSKVFETDFQKITSLPNYYFFLRIKNLNTKIYGFVPPTHWYKKDEITDPPKDNIPIVAEPPQPHAPESQPESQNRPNYRFLADSWHPY